MNITFREEFNISQEEFEKTNAFDIILNVDTKYFVDPAKIRECTIREFKEAGNKIETFFNTIILLLRKCRSENDVFWKKANQLLTFKEIKGTCLGYSTHNINGNSIGPELRTLILKTLKEIIDSGKDSPLIFELIVLFQDKIAADRISDLMTYILKDEIIEYTQRIAKDFNIELKDSIINKSHFFLPYNKYNNSYILLLPKQILSPLPIVYDFEDLDYVCQRNQEVKNTINEMVRDLLIEDYKNISKEQYKYVFTHNSDFADLLIDSYKNAEITEYDFKNDPSGESRWLDDARRNTSGNLLQFTTVEKKDNEIVVKKICKNFKELIENNKLNELLYVEDKPRKESYAQLLFFGIADIYCESNNLSLNKETNNGRGPVDFKFADGYKSILVEVKLTSNKKLIHGIETQLPIYMKQEKCDKAIYLVIDTGYSNNLKNFRDFYNNWTDEQKAKIKVIYVDARRKLSASVA